MPELELSITIAHSGTQHRASVTGTIRSTEDGRRVIEAIDLTAQILNALRTGSPEGRSASTPSPDTPVPQEESHGG